MLSRSADALPDIGEDHVPYCSRYFVQPRCQNRHHTYPGESEHWGGPEPLCHAGTCSGGFGRVPVAVENTFAWPPVSPSARNPGPGSRPGERVPVLPLGAYGVGESCWCERGGRPESTRRKRRGSL